MSTPVHSSGPRTPTVRFACALAATTALLWTAGIRAQTGQDQAVSIDIAGVRASGILRLPAGATSPPVVCLVSDSDTSDLAAALVTEGVASLRFAAPAVDTGTLAQWISWLRNDDRFPTVSVLGEGATLLPAVVAARAARADGVITRGRTDAAAAELGRLVAKTVTADSGSAGGDAGRIAAFVRTVPALGRRGSREMRATTPRRSLRHTVLASVGAVRIGLEWGQPLKRGREIWGALVPWNRVWMPGADESTVLTTDGPILIGSLEIPAGDHTFYTRPSADRFQLLVSRDVGQFHTVYEASLVTGSVDMTLTTRPDVVEGLTFAIDAQGPAATLKLIWDTREYSVALTAPAR